MKAVQYNIVVIFEYEVRELSQNNCCNLYQKRWTLLT
jgi:hypothetical protein